MFYLSLVLIFLGILIFVYSIIADAMRRRGANPSAEGAGGAAASGASGAVKQPAPENKRIRPPVLSKKQTVTGENSAVTAPAANAVAVPGPDESDMTAVLFEDNSRIIDYGSETVSIDPGRAGYKKIKRIGSGRFSIEKAGISFLMGKKLYRYDFHRVRDVKTGDKHLALFLAGSDSVKLFIFNAGSAAIAGAAAAYGEYRGGGE